MKSRVPFSVIVALWLTGAKAHAEPALSSVRCVEVTPASCTISPVERDAFVGALRVELAASGFEVRSTPCASAGFALSLEPISCEPSAHDVEIVIVDPSSGARVSRQVAVAALASAMRPRTVALASAELVAALDAARTTTQTPAAPGESMAPEAAPAAMVPSVPQAALPTAAPATVSPPAAYPQFAPPMVAPGFGQGTRRSVLSMLGAQVEYRYYATPATGLLGGRLFSAWRGPGNRVELRGDLTAATGARDVTLGHVGLHLIAAALGAMWVVGDDRLSFTLGPMAEIGYAWTSGRASGAADSAGGGRLSAALLGDAGVRVALTPKWFVVVEIGAGGEIAGVRALADGTQVAGVNGFLADGRAGVAYAP